MGHPTKQPAHSAWRSSLLISLIICLAGCGTDTNSSAVVAVDTTATGDAQPGAGDAAATDGATTADAAADAIQVTVDDFDCITDWSKVRRFRLKSLNGRLTEALAVANNADGGVYPPGTVIQLVPTEAMVKHEPGWSAATKDWEFFLLKVQASKTEIVARGTTEVVNDFKGNCFGCHAKAKPKWDLVCEQDHGCDPLPFSGEVIEILQNSDARCKKK